MNPVSLSAGTRASRPPDRDTRGPGFAPVGPRGFGKLCGFIARLPAFALLGLIRIYQRTLSPVLPAVFGSACGCRFAPTCSHYAAEAIQTHGALAGTVLAAVRLLKCSPLHPGGFDPVPPRRPRLMCVRSAPVSFPTSPASRLSSP